jgi:cytidine deaminase
MQAEVKITYLIHENSSSLKESDRSLINEVREVCKKAYAPYSQFRVGALALLDNESKVHGTNQENASYPIGLCAERVLLAAVSSFAPDTAIDTIAISYESDTVSSSEPVAPCGICRQSLVEFESRFTHPLRVLITGQTGKIFEFRSASDLLPFAFKHFHLGK